MNFDSNTAKQFATLIQVFTDFYPDEDLTVADNGFAVSVWLLERPDVYVRIDKESRNPYLSDSTVENQSIIKEVMIRMAATK